MNIVGRKINLKTIEKTTIERHPVPVLGIDYKVKIVYKNIKITELDINNKTIIISLPNKYKKMTNTNILDLAIEKMYEQIAKVEVERAMENARLVLGFAPEDYEICYQRNILGKCEGNKIIINPEIVMFKREIIDYIIIHEYCHLKYVTHANGFIKMLEKYVPEYKKYEKVVSNIYKF